LAKAAVPTIEPTSRAHRKRRRFAETNMLESEGLVISMPQYHDKPPRATASPIPAKGTAGTTINAAIAGDLFAEDVEV
jgi:hypothetical protein